MYPKDYGTYVNVEGITSSLCGRSRPGHFKGVATIVAKLFNIAKPDKAYFGQKDFQQTVVIRRMVSDLNMAVEIVVGPTLREPDGLAMSSRNAYLKPMKACRAALYHALESARMLAKRRCPRTLTAHILGKLREEPLIETEYVEVVNHENLEPLTHTGSGAVIAAAVRIGGTRLIDNIIIS
jgi:pantoate--beta-alanine ligase